MQSAADAKHVLMIVDENYLHRTCDIPSSGVAIESRIVRDAKTRHADNWIGCIAVDNQNFDLPDWLRESNPKMFDFNDDGIECVELDDSKIQDL